MSTSYFVRRSSLPHPPERVFAWHAAPGAFARLTPPWEKTEVEDPGRGIENGSRVVLRVKAGPVWKRWIAEHRDIVIGRQFRDVQVEGPFARWNHLHRFEPEGDTGSVLEDRIEYAPPLGAVGRLFGGGFLARKLDRMFTYRHATTAGDVDAHARWSTKPLRILVTGSHGLVGSALVPYLTGGGHEVVPLLRTDPAPGKATWAPDEGRIDLAAAGPLDAVVHLAGENIARGRWNDARKARIRDSRVVGTGLLAEALARLDPKPRVLVAASAVGLYGDRGEELLPETAAPGDGWLADVAQAWEAAAEPARDAGLRVAHVRLGVVLSAAGGALPRLVTPISLGVGGRVGSGRQYVPWIALDDVLDVFLRALVDEGLDGPVNAVAPEEVTNRDLTKALGRVLRRPTLVPLPAWAARLLLGEMADGLLLASQRVVPARLRASDHPFRYPTLAGALPHLLGRTTEKTE